MVNDNFHYQDDSDYRSLTLTADEFAAAMLMDSVIDAAKHIPERIYMDQQNWKDPIVELAYKLNKDNNNE